MVIEFTPNSMSQFVSQTNSFCIENELFRMFKFPTLLLMK